MQLSVNIHLSLCDVSRQIRDRMGDICKQAEIKWVDLSNRIQSKLLFQVINDVDVVINSIYKPFYLQPWSEDTKRHSKYCGVLDRTEWVFKIEGQRKWERRKMEVSWCCYNREHPFRNTQVLHKDVSIVTKAIKSASYWAQNKVVHILYH